MKTQTRLVSTATITLPGAVPDERALVAALRSGDEDAFITLVERHHSSMVQLALAYVPSYAIAEEVVQDAWLGVLKGIQRFEGRSSLKTWIFQILINCAKTRGQAEQRYLPFSALQQYAADADEPSVDPSRFRDGEPGQGHWVSPPRRWDTMPEERLLSRETLEVIRQTLALLPPLQRSVLVLRDIEGLSGAEACALLEISEINQRVSLHRARARVRQALERYFDEH